MVTFFADFGGNMLHIRYDIASSLVTRPFEIGVRHLQLGFSTGSTEDLTSLLAQDIIEPVSFVTQSRSISLIDRVYHISIGLLETLGYLAPLLSLTVSYFDETMCRISSDDHIAYTTLDTAFQNAAEKGDLLLINQLIASHTIYEHRLKAALLKAITNGHGSIVEKLCEQGMLCSSVNAALVHMVDRRREGLIEHFDPALRRMAQIELELAVYYAMSKGSLTIYNHLELVGRSLDPSASRFVRALRSSAKEDRLDVFQALLPHCIPDQYNALYELIEHAAEHNHPEIVRSILEHCRDIPYHVFQKPLEKATVRNHSEIVRMLLSKVERIDHDDRQRLIQAAAGKGYIGLVSQYLELGPIPALTLGRIILTVPLVHRSRVDGLFRLAELTEQVPLRERCFQVSLKDIKENPVAILDRISRDGFNKPIHFTDQPRAVDTGGLTRQFLSELGKALLEKEEITLSPKLLPTVRTPRDRHVLKLLGTLCSHLNRKNVSRSDKLVIGQLFDPRFFRLVRAVACQESNAYLARILREINPDLAYITNLIQNPESPEAKQAYVDMTGASPEEALALARADFATYIVAAGAFLEAATPLFLREVRRTNPLYFAKGVIGEPVSKAKLIEAIRIKPENRTERLELKQRWIEELISDSNLAWRKAFLFAATGSETLVPGMNIELKEGEHSDRFSFSTCLNLVTLPSGRGICKADFKESFRVAVEGANLNIM